MLGALRRDAEQLPQRGPVRLTDKAIRDLDRRRLVAETVDSEGVVRPQVLTGYTRAEAEGRKYVDRVLRK